EGVGGAGRVVQGGAEVRPGEVVPQFHGGDHRGNVLRAAGQRVEGIVADGPVNGVVDVEAVDVAVPRQAEVDHVEVAGLGHPGRGVVGVVNAGLEGVAGPDEVLAGEVAERDLLGSGVGR